MKIFFSVDFFVECRFYFNVLLLVYLHSFLFFTLFSQFLSSQFLDLGVDGVDMSHVLLVGNDKPF